MLVYIFIVFLWGLGTLPFANLMGVFRCYNITGRYVHDDNIMYT